MLAGMALGVLVPQRGDKTGMDAPVRYQILPASRFDVVTGKSGLLGFAGHAHRIRASQFSGEIVYDPEAPGQGSVHIDLPVNGLDVLTPSDTAEIRQVRAAMLTDVLHPDAHPEITLDGTLESIDGDSATVQAVLTMEGVADTLPIRVALHVTQDTIVATARFSVRQSDFGITPYSGGPLGTVKVADRVTFEINAEAAREP